MGHNFSILGTNGPECTPKALNACNHRDWLISWRLVNILDSCFGVRALWKEDKTNTHQMKCKVSPEKKPWHPFQQAPIHTYCMSLKTCDTPTTEGLCGTILALRLADVCKPPEVSVSQTCLSHNSPAASSSWMTNEIS